MEKKQELPWEKLTFNYYPTDYNVRCYFRDGKWGEIEVSSSPYIDLHIAATSLHYSQECFEGLKAFRGKDGKVRIFRMDENAKRMANSARAILMEPVPAELFEKMCTMAVQLNKDYIPPYGTGASLYLRPLEIGITPRVGVKRADEYCFIVLVSPVGPYFASGFKPSNICISREYDRVAPKGTGRVKIGGNYACSLKATDVAHQGGYSAMLFLDPKEKKYLDECGPANFFAIKDNTYITPKSESILPSITNMSFMQIARDLGLKVEERHIPVEELSTMEEASACGTAAVASPIAEIDDIDTGDKYVISKDGNPGPWTTKLYNTLRGIQYGEIEDTHNWCKIIDVD